MFITIVRWIVRVSIVLILILNGAAIYFGIELFKQREELKGRTQKLENTIKQVAATIETDDPNIKVSIPDDQLKTYKSVPGGPQSMDVPLGQLVIAAQNQLIRLNSTRAELNDTKITLARTQEELKQTQHELQLAQNTIADQRAEIERVKNIVSEKETEIQNLSREKVELAAKVESLNTKVETLEAEKRNLTDDLAKMTNDRDYWKKIAKPIVDRRELARKKTGDVKYINAEWNFIVLKLNDEIKDILPPNSELLIHRGDSLVTKVKIISLIDEYAIAEILTDWQQTPVEIGDFAAFPLSPEEQAAAAAKAAAAQKTSEIELASAEQKTVSAVTASESGSSKPKAESALDILSSVSVSSGTSSKSGSTEGISVNKGDVSVNVTDVSISGQ